MPAPTAAQAAQPAGALHHNSATPHGRAHGRRAALRAHGEPKRPSPPRHTTWLPPSQCLRPPHTLWQPLASALTQPVGRRSRTLYPRRRQWCVHRRPAGRTRSRECLYHPDVDDVERARAGWAAHTRCVRGVWGALRAASTCVSAARAAKTPHRNVQAKTGTWALDILQAIAR